MKYNKEFLTQIQILLDKLKELDASISSDKELQKVFLPTQYANQREYQILVQAYKHELIDEETYFYLANLSVKGICDT